MTNNTITLPRELVADFIEYSVPINKDDAAWMQAKTKLRAALAAPVPPAGGKVEAKPVGYVRALNLRNMLLAPHCCSIQMNGFIEDSSDVALYHQDDFTRLQADAEDVSKSYEALAHVYAATQKGFEKMQAERDALKAELRKTNLTNQDFVSQIRDLQSELTKARESLQELFSTMLEYFPEDNPSGHEAMMNRAAKALADQSAPAAKAFGFKIVKDATLAPDYFKCMKGE